MACWIVNVNRHSLLEQDETNKDKQGMPLTVRSVFIIDPKHVIRLMITYPASCGRNFDEILRTLDSLQLTDKQPVATPVNWTPGKDVIVHMSLSDEKAKQVFGEVRVVKPYLRFTKL
jgi:alkyl hydroperoxide reductase subunit AhpC